MPDRTDPLPAHTPSARNAWLIALLAILILAAALRIAPLSHEALDGDECFTIRVATAPWGDALSTIRQDLVHPPVYYFVLKLWLLIAGVTPFTVRVPALLFGLAGVALAAVVARRLHVPPLFSLLAAFLVAINDSQIFFSQQNRSYSFFATLVLVFVLVLLHVLETTGPLAPTESRLSLPNALLLTAMASLLVWTHYVGALYVIAAWLCVLAWPRSPALKLQVTACFAVAALAFLPWLLGELTVYHAKHGLDENLAWEGLPGFYDLRAVFGRFVGIPDFPGGTLAALAILISMCAVAIWRRADSTSKPDSNAVPWRGAILLFSLLGVPPLLLFAVSSKPIALPIFGFRHLLPSLVPAIVLIAIGAARLAAWGRMGHMLQWAAPVVLIALQAAPTWKNTILPRRIPYDQVSQLLNSELAQVPAYTTYPYGIAAPVNLYSQSDRVKPFPSSLHDLPDSRIVVLFRPALAKEAQPVQALAKAGWQVEQHRYFTNAHESRYGTELRVLRRPH